MRPQAPKDLWAQMDAVRAQCGLTEPPADSFTSNDYALRYGMNQNQAYKDIQKLVAQGKVQRVPNCKRHCYVVVA